MNILYSERPKESRYGHFKAFGWYCMDIKSGTESMSENVLFFILTKTSWLFKPFIKILSLMSFAFWG